MKQSFNDLINSDTPVLVDFFAEWCGPCKAMAPALQELSSRMGEKVKIIKVDIDKNQNAAMAYQVQAVPTIVLFHKGKIKYRQAGAMSLGEMEKMIQANV